MATLIRLAVFAILTLSVYPWLPRRAQNVLLLVISYAFYATWSWQFAILLAALTCVNYFLARRIASSPTRGLLIGGVSFNIATLALFKYGNFFLPQLERLVLGTPGALEIVLPIGLSFLILQTISYLVDIYQGVLKPTESLIDFALYLAYFPKLVSGPIERAKTFLPQIATERRITPDDISRNLALILMGALRKILIADTLYSLIPPSSFENPRSFPAPILWGALLTFGFALYNDFAGYTNIARGISGLFGIELSPNFEYPYLAQTFGEFWSRWHISLSNWLRDYIYFPTARALRQRYRDPRHPLNVIIPPLVTMLVSGLWHAATLPMLLWGALHGLYQAAERIILLAYPRKPANQRQLWQQIPSMLVIFLLVMLAWVPFNTTLPHTLQFWRGLFDFSRWGLPDGRILAIILFAVLLDIALAVKQKDSAMVEWPVGVQIALVVFVCLSVYLIIATGTQIARPFIYQAF